jgi:hypothetical protein
LVTVPTTLSMRVSAKLVDAGKIITAKATIGIKENFFIALEYPLKS